MAVRGSIMLIPIFFCLCLACGLMACLLLLAPSQVNPRFYRTHFLTVLGLSAAALVLTWNIPDPWLRGTLIGAVVAALLGSLAWSLEGAPGGRVLIVLTMSLLALGLTLTELWQRQQAQDPTRESAGLGWLLTGDLMAAAVLGSATTAMLMGHSYLIAPAMSLTPLLRLMAALFIATLLRMLLAGVGVGLCCWTTRQGISGRPDVMVLLPVRWALGFIGPLILAWMAWQTAKLRSTQSATGILYVVVILCFLGELTGQLLLAETGFVQ
jgi:hypothetical protein